MRVTSRASFSKKSSSLTVREPLWAGPSGEGDSGDPLCDDYLTGVYQILNLVNGKVYVGGGYRSLGGRIRQHRRDLRAGIHPNKHLQNAWNKYGSKAFRFCILERCPPESVKEREQYWLDRKEAVNRDKGYNISPTAGSPLGVKHSEETRKKFSEAGKKRMLNPENRYKAGNSMRGKHHPDEVKEKLRITSRAMWDNPAVRNKIVAGNTGKVRTAETKKKTSDALKGRVISEQHRKKIGDSKRGKKLSPEAIAKRTAKQKGMKRSEETRKKMSEAGKRRGISSETGVKMNKFIQSSENRERQRNKMTGTKASEEARRAMSEAQRRRFSSDEERKKASERMMGNQNRLVTGDARHNKT